MRTVAGVLVLLAVASGVAEGQQSVGGPRVIAPTAREINEAREATALKCLSIESFAAQTLNSAGEPAIAPRRRTTRGGLGLGAMDASEGMSRPPLDPQFHFTRGDIEQRGQWTFRGATAARQVRVSGCSDVLPKVRPAKMAADGVSPSPR
jgi:hypothetical protein